MKKKKRNNQKKREKEEKKLLRSEPWDVIEMEIKKEEYMEG